MPSLEQQQELVLWTQHSALDEAKSVFAQFDAAFQTVPCDSPSRLATSPVFVFYLPHGEQEAAVERGSKYVRCPANHRRWFSTPPTTLLTSRFALAQWSVGRNCRTRSGRSTFQHLKQLLRARHIAVNKHPKHKATALDARHPAEAAPHPNAVGLRFEHYTSCPSRIGRREGHIQVHKKIRDFAELLALMDDYVVAPKEEEWL